MDPRSRHVTHVLLQEGHLWGRKASAALAAYSAAHPRAWATLKPVLGTTLGARTGDLGTDLPVIALDLQPTAP